MHLGTRVKEGGGPSGTGAPAACPFLGTAVVSVVAVDTHWHSGARPVPLFYRAHVPSTLRSAGPLPARRALAQICRWLGDQLAVGGDGNPLDLAKHVLVVASVKKLLSIPILMQTNKHELQ